MKEGRIIWGMIFLWVFVGILKLSAWILMGYGVFLLAKNYLNPEGVKAVIYILIGAILWFPWLKNMEIKQKDDTSKK